MKFLLIFPILWAECGLYALKTEIELGNRLVTFPGFVGGLKLFVQAIILGPYLRRKP